MSWECPRCMVTFDDPPDDLVGLEIELKAAKQRIAELEKSTEEAWASRNQLLKDSNSLLDQVDKGPLSSNEWEIRAIRAEQRIVALDDTIRQLKDIDEELKEAERHNAELEAELCKARAEFAIICCSCGRPARLQGELKQRLTDILARIRDTRERHISSAEEHADSCSEGRDCSVYKTKMHVAGVLESLLAELGQ